jgi:hypothetical protein
MGHQEKFLSRLRNHRSRLRKKPVEMGRTPKLSAASPRYLTVEDGRWD